VHETNQVQQLAVENLSSDAVFIQAGDMVKGGAQDRMMTNDFTLLPHSGRLPTAAFCVEQSRWGQRGSEPAATFSGSPELASVSFDPRGTWDQASVWKKISELQQALVAILRKPKTAASVASLVAPVSPSLMLTQT